MLRFIQATWLNDRQDGGDLARALGLPVILIVGVRLCCLNNAPLPGVVPYMAEPDARVAAGEIQLERLGQ